MKILVTGAHGMLGSDLVPLLAGRGHEVSTADLPHLDILDREAMAQAVRDFRADWVVHGAAMTDVDGCERLPEQAARVNGDGTRNVVLAAREAQSRVVYISTDYVFDGSAHEPIPVDAPTGPLSAYGSSKLAGERAVLEAGDGHVIVRTSWLYGVHGRNFPRSILQAADAGRELRVVDDQRGRPTYTRDLAAFLAELVERGGTGIYHAANGGETTWHGFARRVLDLTGRGAVPVTPIPTHELGRPAPRPGFSVLDCSRLEREGFTPLRSWEEALRQYLAEEPLTSGPARL